jgi:hypothetical protein
MPFASEIPEENGSYNDLPMNPTMSFNLNAIS